MALGVEGRRATARQEILRACWALADEHGLSSFTLRQVASAVGIQAPSLYSYFSGKDAMYDAMFTSAAEEFAATMAAIPRASDPRTRLRSATRAYLGFCTDSPVRHQLLFQRTLPGFEPSAQAFAPAVRAYEHMRTAFAEIGISDPKHLDLWTALVSGLAAQQMANEPGGRRWTRLTNDAVDMFLRQVQGDRR